MHYYLSPWEQAVDLDGGLLYQPLARAGQWSVIDLRPDPTKVDGHALVSCTERPLVDPPGSVYLGESLDATPSTSNRRGIESRLGLPRDILTGTYRQIIVALLVDHATEDGTRWRPLKPMSRGANAWEIHLGGLVFSAPRIAGGATYSDDFNRADSTDLGVNWSEAIVDWSISANQLAPGTTGTGTVRWTQEFASSDNYSQATIANTSGGSLGVFTRASVDLGAYYLWRSSGTQWDLFKNVGGTFTAIGTYVAAIATNDVAKVEANGSTIKGFVGGIERVSVTDTAITTGTFAGIRTSGSAATRYDDWSGADLAGAAGQTVSPTGVASGEAFGTATVQPGPVTVSPTGVASSEAFGTASVSIGVPTISPAGVVSSEAFGSPTVAGPVSAFGIASAELFGIPAVLGEVLANAWRLVPPSITEKWPVRRSLQVPITRELTVFGDELGLFTSEDGYTNRAELSDEDGAITAKYVWLGGRVNITSAPAVRDLWLAHGFDVLELTLSYPGTDVFPAVDFYPGVVV